MVIDVGMGQRARTLSCLIDESGSLSRSEKGSFRVGFLMTCRLARLWQDIRRLKREQPPRGKSGEYHAREDDAATKGMIRSLLCLNREPQMYIIEWPKHEFPDSAFVKNRFRVFQDSNPLIASFAITASEIAAAASAQGFSLVDIVVEATMPDLASNHRAHRQAINAVLSHIFEKQAKIRRAPAGTKTAIRVSTARKRDCPILSFVDYWLWEYSRRHDRDDSNVLPEEIEARTHVRVMTPKDLGNETLLSGSQEGANLA